jgi:hypothetical protein
MLFSGVMGSIFRVLGAVYPVWGQVSTGLIEASFNEFQRVRGKFQWDLIDFNF